MTKQEIYEALARGEWERIEHCEHDIWWKFGNEDYVTKQLSDEIQTGNFHPDNWRMRKEADDEQKKQCCGNCGWWWKHKNESGLGSCCYEVPSAFEFKGSFTEHDSYPNCPCWKPKEKEANLFPLEK